MDHAFCPGCGYALLSSSDPTVETTSRELNTPSKEDARTVAFCTTCEVHLAHGSRYCHLCGAAFDEEFSAYGREQKPILLHLQRYRMKRYLPKFVRQDVQATPSTRTSYQDALSWWLLQGEVWRERLLQMPKRTVWIAMIAPICLLIVASIVLTISFPPVMWTSFEAVTPSGDHAIHFVWSLPAYYVFAVSLSMSFGLNMLGALVAQSHASRVNAPIRALMLHVLSCAVCVNYAGGCIQSIYALAAPSSMYVNQPLLLTIILGIMINILVLLLLPRSKGGNTSYSRL